MGLDIRIPIGLMFAIVGGLLAGYGLFGDQSIYQRSLGMNINLFWGIVLIGFSMLVLFFALRNPRAR